MISMILLLPRVVFSSLQPGSSLEQTHIFVLAHILRRPIIVYGVKYYKSFRGETLGYTRFQGERSLRSALLGRFAQHLPSVAGKGPTFAFIREKYVLSGVSGMSICYSTTTRSSSLLSGLDTGLQ